MIMENVIFTQLLICNLKLRLDFINKILYINKIIIYIDVKRDWKVDTSPDVNSGTKIINAIVIFYLKILKRL